MFIPTLFRGLPESETSAAYVLTRNIMSLNRQVEKFAAALALRRSCEGQTDQFPITLQWIFIAARDATMTIYHFAKTLEAIRGGCKNAPILQGRVDHERLKLAKKIFDARFPDFEALRHSVAHSAEKTRSAESFAMNTFSGSLETPPILMKNSNLYISEGLLGDKFTTTHEGEILSYDFNEVTLEALQKIETMVSVAFSPKD